LKLGMAAIDGRLASTGAWRSPGLALSPVSFCGFQGTPRGHDLVLGPAQPGTVMTPDRSLATHEPTAQVISTANKSPTSRFKGQAACGLNGVRSRLPAISEFKRADKGLAITTNTLAKDKAMKIGTFAGPVSRS
jgi:hypothetical protein